MVFIPNDIDTREYSLFTRFVNLLLPMTLILQVYGWGVYNFAIIITTIAIFISLLKKRKLFFTSPKPFILFFVYFFIIYFISYSDGEELIPLQYLFFFFAFSLFFNEIKLNLFLYYYRKIALFCIAYFLIQEILLFAIGVKLPGIIPFFPISITNDVTDLLKITRNSSFFSEPAFFAQFLLPLLSVELFAAKDKSSYLRAIMIGLVCLLLRSGNAIIGLSIIFLFYIIHLFIVKSRYKFLVLSMTIILTPIMLHLYLKSDSGAELIGRTSEISGQVDNNSGFVRVWRGYYVFASMSETQKIFGIGNDTNIRNTINNTFIRNYFNENEIYVNTFQSFLIRTGCIGAFLFILTLLNLWKRNSFSSKAILTIMFALSFVASFFLSFVMILFMIIPYKIKYQGYE